MSDVPVRAAVRDVESEAFGQRLLASVFETGNVRLPVLCLHLGELGAPGSVPVRLHSSCLLGEVFRSRRCDCAWQLEYAVSWIARAGRGIVVYLPHDDGRGAGISVLLKSHLLMERGMSSAEAFDSLGLPADLRDYAAATAVLKSMGVAEASLLTNNPDKMRALESAGIRVSERVPIVIPKQDHDLDECLRGKVRDLGHLIEGVAL